MYVIPHMEPHIESNRKWSTSDIIKPVKETMDPIFITTVPKSRDFNICKIREKSVEVVAFLFDPLRKAVTAPSLRKLWWLMA